MANKKKKNRYEIGKLLTQICLIPVHDFFLTNNRCIFG
jgi:hypothetical protein